MSGPKTPYGYDPIFLEALAGLQMDSPEILNIETEKNPYHLRALFNQFRASWNNQAAIHHKRKEFQPEKACRQNFYVLQQYECRLTPTGIALHFRGKATSKITKHGRVRLAIPIEEEDILMPSSPTEGIPTYNSKKIEEESIRAMGITKKERVIPDNPPLSNGVGDPSIGDPNDNLAFFLATGRRPKDENELAKFMESGEAPRE